MLLLPILDPTLSRLPERPSTPPPHPYAISADGRRLVGGYSPSEGFVYDVRRGSIRTFGHPFTANGIAARADVIVGVTDNAAWIRQGALTKLPPLKGDTASVASAVAPDGSVAGGYSQSEQGTFHPILWGITPNGGITRRRLPTPSGFPDGHIRGVANAGRAAVGIVFDRDHSVRAFSYNGLGLVDLLPVPKWATESAADAVTPDGRFAVGYVASKRQTSAAIWTVGGAVRTLAGPSPSAALCVDPAGKWVGGYSGEQAILWSAAGTPRTLNQLLGSKAAEWTFDQISGIGRSEGRVTLCGWGHYRSKNAGFVVTFRDK